MPSSPPPRPRVPGTPHLWTGPPPLPPQTLQQGLSAEIFSASGKARGISLGALVPQKMTLPGTPCLLNGLFDPQAWTHQRRGGASAQLPGCMVMAVPQSRWPGQGATLGSAGP